MAHGHRVDDGAGERRVADGNGRAGGKETLDETVIDVLEYNEAQRPRQTVPL